MLEPRLIVFVITLTALAVAVAWWAWHVLASHYPPVRPGESILKHDSCYLRRGAADSSLEVGHLYLTSEARLLFQPTRLAFRQDQPRFEAIHLPDVYSCTASHERHGLKRPLVLTVPQGRLFLYFSDWLIGVPRKAVSWAAAINKMREPFTGEKDGDSEPSLSQGAIHNMDLFLAGSTTVVVLAPFVDSAVPGDLPPTLALVAAILPAVAALRRWSIEDSPG